MSRARTRDEVVAKVLAWMRQQGIPLTSRQDRDLRAEIDRALQFYGDRLDLYDGRAGRA